MSSDWSFGSRSRPCSQSRKVSIGIMVDPLPKKGYESSTKYDMGMTAIPRGDSKLGSDAERIEVTGDGKNTKLQREEGYPWVTPRSNCKNSVISEGDSKIKIDRRSKHKASKKLEKLKGPSPDKLVKFSHNATFFKPKNPDEKRCDSQKNNGEVNRRMDAVEKSFSALEQGVFTSAKVPPGDNTGNTVNQRSENLRMKLCELMGSVFSPDKDQNSSPPADEGVAFLQPEPNVDQANGASVQPKHNSDTIASDSENHGCSKRRVVTRSKMRKRDQKNASPKKVERGHLNAHKDKLKGRNAYFHQSDAPKKRSSILKQKNRIPTTTTESKETTTKIKETERKFSCAEPRRISFPLQETENKFQPAASRKENSSLAGRSSPRGVRPQNSPSLSLRRVGENVRPSTVMTEKDPLEQLLEKNPDGGEDINIKLAEDIACGNNTVNTSTVKNSADQQDNFVSPTLGRRSPGMSSSPGSPSKDNWTKQGNPSVAEAMFNLERMFTFRNFNLKETRAQPREHPDIGNDGSDSRYSNASDSDSSEFSSVGELDSSGKDPGEEETLSPEVVTVKKPKSVLHMPKRLRSLRGTKPYDGRPVSRSSNGKGTRTTKKQDSGEFHVHDEFARAIGPLAMSLEKIKSKVKSVTTNKSSEILNSLAEKIQTQMQSVESQVQSDVEKLKIFSKQKRKFLEREFQEQEKQLKLIHERFKKELNQHVQYCIETTEGLEENKIELKKILEKQNASHRKLLMQVEQAAQTEIQDAEKRISNMNKLAREQMLQLRLLIEQFLGEGVLF